MDKRPPGHPFTSTDSDPSGWMSHSYERGPARSPPRPSRGLLRTPFDGLPLPFPGPLFLPPPPRRDNPLLWNIPPLSFQSTRLGSGESLHRHGQPVQQGKPFFLEPHVARSMRPFSRGGRCGWPQCPRPGTWSNGVMRHPAPGHLPDSLLELPFFFPRPEHPRPSMNIHRPMTEPLADPLFSTSDRPLLQHEAPLLHRASSHHSSDMDLETEEYHSDNFVQSRSNSFTAASRATLTPGNPEDIAMLGPGTTVSRQDVLSMISSVKVDLAELRRCSTELQQSGNLTTEFSLPIEERTASVIPRSPSPEPVLLGRAKNAAEPTSPSPQILIEDLFSLPVLATASAVIPSSRVSEPSLSTFFSGLPSRKSPFSDGPPMSVSSAAPSKRDVNHGISQFDPGVLSNGNVVRSSGRLLGYREIPAHPFDWAAGFTDRRRNPLYSADLSPHRHARLIHERQLRDAYRCAEVQPRSSRSEERVFVPAQSPSKQRHVTTARSPSASPRKENTPPPSPKKGKHKHHKGKSGCCCCSHKSKSSKRKKTACGSSQKSSGSKISPERGTRYREAEVSWVDAPAVVEDCIFVERSPVKPEPVEPISPEKSIGSLSPAKSTEPLSPDKSEASSHRVQLGPPESPSLEEPASGDKRIIVPASPESDEWTDESEWNELSPSELQTGKKRRFSIMLDDSNLLGDFDEGSEDEGPSEMSREEIVLDSEDVLRARLMASMIGPRVVKEESVTPEPREPPRKTLCVEQNDMPRNTISFNFGSLCPPPGSGLSPRVSASSVVQPTFQIPAEPVSAEAPEKARAPLPELTLGTVMRINEVIQNLPSGEEESQPPSDSPASSRASSVDRHSHSSSFFSRVLRGKGRESTPESVDQATASFAEPTTERRLFRSTKFGMITGVSGPPLSKETTRFGVITSVPGRVAEFSQSSETSAIGVVTGIPRRSQNAGIMENLASRVLVPPDPAPLFPKQAAPFLIAIPPARPKLLKKKIHRKLRKSAAKVVRVGKTSASKLSSRPLVASLRKSAKKLKKSIKTPTVLPVGRLEELTRGGGSNEDGTVVNRADVTAAKIQDLETQLEETYWEDLEVDEKIHDLEKKLHHAHAQKNRVWMTLDYLREKAEEMLHSVDHHESEGNEDDEWLEETPAQPASRPPAKSHVVRLPKAKPVDPAEELDPKEQEKEVLCPNYLRLPPWNSAAARRPLSFDNDELLLALREVKDSLRKKSRRESSVVELLPGGVTVPIEGVDLDEAELSSFDQKFFGTLIELVRLTGLYRFQAGFANLGERSPFTEALLTETDPEISYCFCSDDVACDRIHLPPFSLEVRKESIQQELTKIVYDVIQTADDLLNWTAMIDEATQDVQETTANDGQLREMWLTLVDKIPIE